MITIKKSAKKGLISIVIPVLGTKEPINETLKMIPYKEIEKAGYKTEVVIAWTPYPPGSKEKLKIKDKHARIITQKKRGYGNAYLAGFKAAKGDIIITFDADKTYPAEDIPRLIRILNEKNLDFLNTNRLVKYEKGAFSRINLFGNHIFSFMTKFLLGVKFQDSQSGMWVFRKKILKKLGLKQTGMDFSTEIKIRAYENVKCGEEIIFYRARDTIPTLNWFRDGKRVMKYILKEFFDKIFKRKR